MIKDIFTPEELNTLYSALIILRWLKGSEPNIFWDFAKKADDLIFKILRIKEEREKS